MDLSEGLTVTLTGPSEPGDVWTCDVVGLAGTEATLGTGTDASMAVETALVNLEQLRAYLVIKLLEVRIARHVNALHGGNLQLSET